MEIDDTSRAALAERFRWIRDTRFWGKKSEAYRFVELNSATWNRLETGQSVKPHTLTNVLAKLWPEHQGDWQRVLADDSIGSVGGRTHTGDHVRLTGEDQDSGVSNADLLREIVAMRQALERLAGGQPGPEPVDRAGGKD